MNINMKENRNQNENKTDDKIKYSKTQINVK